MKGRVEKWWGSSPGCPPRLLQRPCTWSWLFKLFQTRIHFVRLVQTHLQFGQVGPFPIAVVPKITCLLVLIFVNESEILAENLAFIWRDLDFKGILSLFCPQFDSFQWRFCLRTAWNWQWFWSKISSFLHTCWNYVCWLSSFANKTLWVFHSLVNDKFFSPLLLKFQKLKL